MEEVHAGQHAHELVIHKLCETDRTLESGVITGIITMDGLERPWRTIRLLNAA